MSADERLAQRGYRQAESRGLFGDSAHVAAALAQTRNPVTCCFLLPFAPARQEASLPDVPELIARPLRDIPAGSARHPGLVEAMRRVYRQKAVAADRADKQRVGRED